MKLDDLWAKSDKDGNGYLEKQEAQDFLEQIQTNLILPDRSTNFKKSNFSELFNNFDEDKNGHLDKGEMATLIKKVFKKQPKSEKIIAP